MWQETTPNVLYLVIICLISLRFSPFPAHPNIKLFITQYALQIVQQAVYLGVSVLGYPSSADQNYSAKETAT